MEQIKVEKNVGGIGGLCMVEPAVHGDARGYFMETYGKWYGAILSAENKKQYLIPEGFAHGFLVLSDEADFAIRSMTSGIRMLRAAWYGTIWKSALSGLKYRANTKVAQVRKAICWKTARH